MSAGFWHRLYSTGRQDDFDQGEPDEESCSECGSPTDDGEGWDGLCGNCADRQVMAAEAKRKQRKLDDHDRRYDDVYSTQKGDTGDEPFDF